MNKSTNTRSSVSARMFASIFRLTTRPHTRRSYPLPIPFWDGTDPHFGGHQAGPGGAR